MNKTVNVESVPVKQLSLVLWETGNTCVDDANIPFGTK